MRDQREQIRLPGFYPRGFALEDQVAEGERCGGCRGCGGAVLPFDGPFGQLAGKEVDEVMLDYVLPWCTGDARDENWGEEGAGFDVEVGAG